MTPERYKEITELTDAEQALATKCVREGRPIIQKRLVTVKELAELREMTGDNWYESGTLIVAQKIIR